MEKYIAQLNGRITVSNLSDFLDRIGRGCREKFVAEHQLLAEQSIEREGFDIVNAYNSVIQNRHDYVHKGNLTLTLSEVIKYAPQGVLIFGCVTKSLSS